MSRRPFLIVCLLFLVHVSGAQPVRLAVVGISHGHSSWIFGRRDDSVARLVAIYEPSRPLAEKMASRFNLDPSLFHDDLGRMLDAVKPEGVMAFGSTYDHLQVVEEAVPRGIPVMVEKPLATTVAHAERIDALSRKHGVPVLTNYETSWYPVTDRVHSLTRDTTFMGRIRKVVVHDGHQGPREIGVSKEFFDWLTDPVLNGGGALTDFGCYGANLMTHLMDGQVPLTVTAVTQQLKPHIYPKVDDEATIILTYPTAQCIIQASWNWPYNRKDMAVYGEAGYAVTKDAREMRVKGKSGAEQTLVLRPEETGTYTSPFLYFSDVIRGRLTVPKYGLYSLENNLLVVRILDAARESAKTGRAVTLH
jgi:predicted dehydrogenase